MAKRSIRHASLHQSAFVETYGDVGRTLPPVGKTFKTWVMYASQEGVTVDFENPKTGASVSFVVPWANVVTATYSPSDKS